MYSRVAGYEYFGKSRCLEDVCEKGKNMLSLAGVI